MAYQPQRCVRGCGNFGNPQHRGLCNACHKKEIQGPRAAVCRTKDCHNQGVQANGGLCQSCAMLSSSSTEPPGHNPRQCKIGACNNFASKQGMCNKHFKERGAQQQQAAPDSKQIGEEKDSGKKPASPLERLQEAYLKRGDAKGPQAPKASEIREFSSILSRILVRHRSADIDAKQDSKLLAELLAMKSDVSAVGLILLAGCPATDICDIAAFLSNLMPDGATFLRSLLKALKNSRRLTALAAVCESVVPEGLESVSLLEFCLLGYTHDPNLFLASLPALLRVLKESKSAAEPGGEEPQSVASRVATMIHALFVKFSYYPTLASHIERELRGFTSPPRARLHKLLREASWLPGSSDDKQRHWVEGEWVAEHGAGGASISARASCVGRRIHGLFRPSSAFAASPARACFDVGQDVAVQWEGKEYRRGIITHIRQHEFCFECSKGKAWLKAPSLRHVRPLPNSAARRGMVVYTPHSPDQADLLSRATVRGVGGKRLTLELESGQKVSVHVSRVLVLDPEVPPRATSRGAYDEGSVEGFLYTTQKQDLNLSGNWKAWNTGNKGSLELRLAARGTALVGRWGGADADDFFGTWLGVRDVRCDPAGFSEEFDEGVSLIEKHPSCFVQLTGGEYVCLGNDPLHSFPARQFTIDATITLSALPDEKSSAAILSKQYLGTNKGWLLSVHSDGTVSFLGLQSVGKVTVGKAARIMVVSDGHSLNLFVNETKAEGKLPTIRDSEACLLLGASVNGPKPCSFLKGSVREVRLWCRPLSATELKGPPMLGGGEDGLVGYWPMTSVFQLLPDHSVRQNHGILLPERNDDSLSFPSASAIDSNWQELKEHKSELGFSIQSAEWLVAGQVEFGTSAVSLARSSALWRRGAVYLGGGLRVTAAFAQPSSSNFFVQLQAGHPYSLCPVAAACGPSILPLQCLLVGLSFGPDGCTVSVKTSQSDTPTGLSVIHRSLHKGVSACKEIELTSSPTNQFVISADSKELAVCSLDIVSLFGQGNPEPWAFMGLTTDDSPSEEGKTLLLTSWSVGPFAPLPMAELKRVESTPQTPGAPVSAQSGDLIAVLVRQLKQLEVCTRPTSHLANWQWQRMKWHRELSTAKRLNALKPFVLELVKSLVIPENRWSVEKRASWEIALDQLRTPAEMAKVMLDMEYNIPDHLFWPPWKGKSDEGAGPQAFDGKGMFREAMASVHLEHLRSQRTEIAETLASEVKGLDPKLCLEVLSMCGFNRDRAIAWLLDRSATPLVAERVYQVATQKHWRCGTDQPVLTLPILTAELANPFLGEWATSRGELCLEDCGEFVGLAAQGQATVTDTTPGKESILTGDLAGFLYQTPKGGWRFEGSLLDSSMNTYAQPTPCHFDFSGDRFTGRWSHRSFTGAKAQGEDTGLEPPPGLTGLLNLGNTCYQNSFLQALFQTNALRSRVLRFPYSPVDAKAPRSDRIIHEIQKIFAHMQMTDRPTTTQQPLKCLLPAPFNGSRQQDCYQYGQNLLQLLQEGLDSSPDAGLVSELFGGSLRHVIRCQVCGNSRHNDEKFTDLGVSFPKRYSPITDIRIISGVAGAPLPVPEGFDRIPVNANEGRSYAQQTYICVKRDPRGMPITHLELVNGSIEIDVVPSRGFQLLEGNLNPEGKQAGSVIRLGVRCDPTSSPITQIDLLVWEGKDTKPPEGFVLCPLNLNLASGGKDIRLCYRRGTVVRNIQVIKAESLSQARKLAPEGYTVIKENFSSDSDLPGHSEFFIAYSSAGDTPPITKLSVRERSFLRKKQAHYREYSCHGKTHFLMIEYGSGCPINALELHIPPSLPPKYGDAETLELVPKTPSSAPLPLHTHRWRTNSGDYVRFEPPITVRDVYHVEAHYGGDGFLKGIMRQKTSRLGRTTWELRGSWREPREVCALPFKFTFPSDCSRFEGYWIGHHSKRDWHGEKISSYRWKPETEETPVAKTPPIVNLILLADSLAAPEGYEIVSKTFTGADADLNHRTSGPRLRLAFQRQSDETKDLSPISSVMVLVDEIEPVPEGWEIVQMLTKEPGHAPVQMNANPNYKNDGTALMICVKRVSKGDGKRKRMLSNITVSLARHGAPEGYRRIERTATADLEADLNGGSTGGTRMYLAIQQREIKARKTKDQIAAEKAMRHAVEGEWRSSEGGHMTIRVKRRTAASEITATFKYGTATILGMLTEQKNGKYKLHGRYQRREMKFPMLMNLEFDRKITSFKGSYVFSKAACSWVGTKDDYATLVYKQDDRALWENGKEVFSSNVGGNTLQGMVEDYFSAQVLDGTNQTTCDSCGKHTPAVKFQCVRLFPSHLILCVKRFELDYRTGRTSKMLDAVRFGPTLRLPVVRDMDIAKVVFGAETDEKVLHQLRQSNTYGLYACVVHSGSRLNGGHYFAYARYSDADLSMEENPDAPWHKFNDKKIHKSSWANMQEETDSSVRDTMYILFFRRIGAGDAKTPGDAIREAALDPSPELPELVIHDNQEFLKKSLATSGFFLQHLDSMTRTECKFADRFLNVPAGSSTATSRPQPEHCPICYSRPPCEGRCPYASFTTGSCSHCGLKLPVPAIPLHEQECKSPKVVVVQTSGT